MNFPYGVCDCGFCFKVEERKDILKPIKCKKCGKEVIKCGIMILEVE